MSQVGIKRDNEFWKKVYFFMAKHNISKDEAENHVVLFYHIFGGKDPEYRYCPDCNQNNLVDEEYDCCDECGWSKEVEEAWEEFWDEE